MDHRVPLRSITMPVRKSLVSANSASLAVAACDPVPEPTIDNTPTAAWQSRAQASRRLQTGQGQSVAGQAEAGHAPGHDVGDEVAAPEILAGGGIGEMHLHHRHAHAQQGVPHRHGGMGVGRRVQHDAVAFGRRSRGSGARVRPRRRSARQSRPGRVPGPAPGRSASSSA